uniref:Uncharacterized protein n=1 Tax=Anguilla anguilla TaxID=7936 RepID=A0A0E9TC73_ANGAN
MFCHLTIHIVLCFYEFPSVHLASVGLTGHNMSLCFVQDFNRHADGHLRW